METFCKVDEQAIRTLKKLKKKFKFKYFQFRKRSKGMRVRVLGIESEFWGSFELSEALFVNFG